MLNVFIVFRIVLIITTKLIVFFFFFGSERGIYILDATSLLQNVLALSLANRNSTIGGGSTKTTKEKLRLTPILTKASAQ